MDEAAVCFRDYLPADLPRLQQIREAAFAPVFRGFAEQVGEAIAPLAFAHAEADQARLLDAICAAGSPHEVVVATQGLSPIGFVAFTVDAARRTGEIGLNAVHPGHAGKGVGTAMYLHVLAVMRQRGAVVASVATGADAAHAPARRAYAKVGFGAPIHAVSLRRLL